MDGFGFPVDAFDDGAGPATPADDVGALVAGAPAGFGGFGAGPGAMLELKVTEIKPDSACDHTLFSLYSFLGRTWCFGSRGSAKIGRNDANCEIALPPDITLSSEHAKLTFEAGEFVVRDCSSRNGTKVLTPMSGFGEGLYDVAALGAQPVALRTGAKIRLGVATLTVRVLTADYVAGASALQKALRAGDAGRVEQLFASEQMLAVDRWMDGMPAFNLSADSYFAFTDVTSTVGLEVRAEHRLPPTMFPLHTAVAAGNVAMVKLLLRAGADVNVRAHPENTTPLHLAVRMGLVPIVRLLLDHGADITMVDSHGGVLGGVPPENFELLKLLTACTRLGGLSANGHLRALRQLVSDEAPPINARCFRGRTALGVAAANGHLACVNWLLRHGGNPSIAANLARQDFDLTVQPPGTVTLDTARHRIGSTPLHEAVLNDHTEVAASLLKASADPNQLNGAGVAAIDTARSEAMLKVCAKKVKINHNGSVGVPLWLAAQCGVLTEQVVQECRRNTSLAVSPRSGLHAVHLAVENGHADVLQALLQRAPDVANVDSPHLGTQQAPLHFAARHGNAEIMSLLLDANADPDHQDDAGKLPLDVIDKRLKALKWQREYCARHGRFSPAAADERDAVWAELVDGFEVARALLIRPDTKLRLAIAADDVEAVFELVRNDEVEHATLNRQFEIPSGSILHWALRKRHIWLAEALVARGVDVNAIDETGDLRTPLHEAATQGHAQLAEAMIRANADVDAREAALQTPLHLAAVQGHKALVGVLLRHGADRTLTDMAENKPFDVSDNADVQYSLAEGQELLALAVLNEEEGTIAQLLDAGICSVNAICTKNKGAIHLAAAHGSVHITRLLLEKGADIDSPGGFYAFTPLHYAAFQGYVELAQLLVAKRADKSILDNDGKTAYELAETEALKRALLQSPAELAASDNPFIGATTGGDAGPDIPIEDACKVCLERPIEVIILPCGHQAFCFHCVQQLTECALCRTTIKEVVKIYRA